MAKCIVWLCNYQTDGIRMLCKHHDSIARGEGIIPSPPPPAPDRLTPKPKPIKPRRLKRKKPAA